MDVLVHITDGVHIGTVKITSFYAKRISRLKPKVKIVYKELTYRDNHRSGFNHTEVECNVISVEGSTIFVDIIVNVDKFQHAVLKAANDPQYIDLTGLREVITLGSTSYAKS